MYFIENISTAASSPHKWLNLCKEKTVQVILAKSWQKSLNITYQVYLLLVKLQIPEISVEKMSIHNTQKFPVLLRDKKHECSLAY